MGINNFKLFFYGTGTNIGSNSKAEIMNIKNKQHYKNVENNPIKSADFNIISYQIRNKSVQIQMNQKLKKLKYFAKNKSAIE